MASGYSAGICASSGSVVVIHINWSANLSSWSRFRQYRRGCIEVVVIPYFSFTSGRSGGRFRNTFGFSFNRRFKIAVDLFLLDFWWL